MRTIFFVAALTGLAAIRVPLRAQLTQAPPTEPNCGAGHTLCRRVSTCQGGYFDSHGACSTGSVFSIYYYYRDT
jgi:hypothetical protein